MIIQILYYLAAFVLGAFSFFVLFVVIAWRRQRQQPETINESRPMGEKVIAVLNPEE